MELKPAVWGAIAGAAALWIVGFSWGGWTTSATASSTAKSQADKAVVMALAPICAERFKREANVQANTDALKKVSSWQRGEFIEKGGWATMATGGTASPGVGNACAELLVV